MKRGPTCCAAAGAVFAGGETDSWCHSRRDMKECRAHNREKKKEKRGKRIASLACAGLVGIHSVLFFVCVWCDKRCIAKGRVCLACSCFPLLSPFTSASPSFVTPPAPFVDLLSVGRRGSASAALFLIVFLSFFWCCKGPGRACTW